MTTVWHISKYESECSRLKSTTHVPETGAINQLYKSVLFGMQIWYQHCLVLLYSKPHTGMHGTEMIFDLSLVTIYFYYLLFHFPLVVTCE